MSYNDRGRPIRGILHSADLSTATVVPIFDQGVATSGGATAITMAADERLVITDIFMVTDTAADMHVYLSDDNDATPETGETILRGPLAANSGIAVPWQGVPQTGAPGATVFAVTSVAAIADVVFTGYIIRV